MSQAKIVKTVIIKADPEQVWDYLTKADKLARWFHEAKADMIAGEDYQLLRENPARRDEPLLWGKVLEADKPNRLVTTFTHEWLKHVETIVTWQLTKIDGGTRLMLTHEGFEACGKSAFDLLKDHDEGWDEHFARLRTVANFF